MSYASEYFASGATDGDPQNQPLAKDLDLILPVETASGSTLVATLRRSVNQASADVEIDSSAGLTTVTGVDSPTAADGSVTRDSDSQVTIHLAADAYDHLRPGLYHFDLTELEADGGVHGRYALEIYLTRRAGRRMS